MQARRLWHDDHYNTFVNIAQIKMPRTLAVVFRATQKAGEKLGCATRVFYGVACVQFVNDCTIGQVCLLTL